MKLCCKCKTKKPTNAFYANKRMKDGFNTFCIVCHKEDNIKRKLLNRSNIDFKTAEAVAKKQYRATNAEQHKAYMKQWHADNTEHIKNYRRQYNHVNKEKNAQYRILNKHKVNARTRKRQAAKLKRTPKWLTQDDLWMMEQAYELAVLRTKLFGFSWEVDHIIPLQGKNVSGLHVPTNLQVIPMIVNRSKSFKYGEHDAVY
jgi:hypothetical protein